MGLAESLSFLNACLNATAATLMSFGWVAIKRKQIERHRRFMLAAFVVSCAFLASYLTRHSIAPETRYTGEGFLRWVYFAILIPHIILAVGVVPLVVRTLFLGWKRRDQSHRKIARITLPIWVYVSVTGVLVYLMLYRFN